MKMSRLLVLTMLSSVTTITSAGFFPKQWEDSDQGIWQAAFEGQYFEQSNNLALFDKPTAGDNRDYFKAPNAEGQWGFRASLAYIFASQNYDIRASYWQVNANQNTSYTVSDPDVNFRADVSEPSHYDFNAAELTLGQYLDLSCCLSLRLGYGIAYANISQKAKSYVDAFSNNIPVDKGYHSFRNNFKGLGPKVGADLAFDINNSWSLLGGLGASVLFGESEVFFVSKDVNNGDDDFYEKEDNKTVFAADAKAGVGFTQTINEDFAFNLEAGYRAAIYFNSLSDDNVNFPQTGSFLTFDDSDYYNYGPYISAALDFM
jgi:hypothetical protein